MERLGRSGSSALSAFLIDRLGMCFATLHITYYWTIQMDIPEVHSLIWTSGLDSVAAPSSSLFNAFASWEKIYNKDAGHF